ncbi:MAG: DEAD/DEAH box helicase, partial [Ramlibacter sp.]
MSERLAIVVPTPSHSGLRGPLSYRSEFPLAPGMLVRVPLGKREVLGVVWDAPPAGQEERLEMEDKPIASALEGLAALSAPWRQLVTFTANYYQRSLGEVALAALPPQLRDLSSVQLARRLKRPAASGTVAPPGSWPALTPEQREALAHFEMHAGPFLLFGATGSGKTEVYLQAAQALLTRDPKAQALVMVPEINLTPQLHARFVERFGPQAVVALHSGMTHPQRLKSWLKAHAGEARIVLGTRMAVFASLPRLRLIVVDEEHDPSYKQQEGARYSARDLAVYRAWQETEDAGASQDGCRVMLGSATPSLESWQSTLTGKYQRLTMSERVGAASVGDG